MTLRKAVELALMQLRAERTVALGSYQVPGSASDDLSSLDENERAHIDELDAAIIALETAWQRAVERISAAAVAIASLAETRLEDMAEDSRRRNGHQLFRCSNYVKAIDKVGIFRTGMEEIMLSAPLWHYDVGSSLRAHAVNHGYDLENSLKNPCKCCEL